MERTREEERSSEDEQATSEKVTEPTSGIEPDPPVYEAGARPIELRGQGARGARSASVGGTRAGASGCESSFVRVSPVGDHEARRSRCDVLVYETSALPSG